MKEAAETPSREVQYNRCTRCASVKLDSMTLLIVDRSLESCVLLPWVKILQTASPIVIKRPYGKTLSSQDYEFHKQQTNSKKFETVQRKVKECDATPRNDKRHAGRQSNAKPLEEKQCGKMKNNDQKCRSMRSTKFEAHHGITETCEAMQEKDKPQLGSRRMLPK